MSDILATEKFDPVGFMVDANAWTPEIGKAIADREGLELTEHWFDFETSTMCTWIAIIQEDGTMLRPTPEVGHYYADERIRCYCVPEMRRMLAAAGLEEDGFYGRDMTATPDVEMPRDIVVARRR